MKKIVIKILICCLFLTLLIFNTNSEHHVHAAEYDLYCDKCGEKITRYTVRLDPTCTTEGSAYCTCTNPTCSGITAVASVYSFAAPIPALGHSYSEHDYTEATCTEAGEIVYKCSRCGDKYTEEIPALGHDYVVKITKKVTCEEDGSKTYTCSRCQKTYSEVIKALGHDYQESEHIEATCTEDGHITTVCKNCKDEKVEILKAIGHDVELKVTKKATCIEDGIKSGICKNCGEEIKEVIPALGHKYPEEWALDKKATIFSEGQESKICTECGNIETQVIPKKEVPVAIPASIGGVGVAGVIFLALKKTGKIGAKKVIEKASKDIAKDVGEEAVKEALEPSFEEKTIVTCLKVDDFYKSLKAQKYLVVVESEYDELKEAIEENEPAITLIDASDKDLNEVKENIESIKNELEEVDVVVSLLVSKEQLENNKDLLEELKTNELIKNYGLVENNASVNLVKLVLPVMKPELKSDESLENIGMVADALGIPGVSSIIDVYISGREIKETIDEGKEEGLGFVDKATIISDLASILGLDTIASVSGLVGDVDDIKSSLEAKIGANEISTSKDAVADIVNVVKDLTDK